MANSKVAPKGVSSKGSKYKKDAKAQDETPQTTAPNKMLIDPNSNFMRKWDLTSIILLGFVMVVTPYEVAFLGTSLDFLFVINRLIDIYFIADMCIQFFLM